MNKKRSIAQIRFARYNGTFVPEWHGNVDGAVGVAKEIEHVFLACPLPWDLVKIDERLGYCWYVRRETLNPAIYIDEEPA